MLIFCRLCAKLKNSKELKTTIDNPAARMKEKLILCCRWNTPADEKYLPKNVCFVCASKLDECWKFAKSVASAEKALRKIFSKVAGAERIQSTVNRRPLDYKCENKTDGIDAMDFVAVKLEPEPTNYYDGNQSGNSAVDTKQTTISDDLSNFIVTKTEGNEIRNEKSDSSIKNAPKARKIKIKPEDDDFLNVLSKNDCNDDGTITDEGVAKLNTSSWNDYEYKCWKCEHISKGVTEYRSHIKSNHPNEPLPYQYSCFDCPKKYSMFGYLVSHIHAAHKPHLKHCCTICSKFFWNFESLKTHRQNHYGTGSFTCPTCDKVFFRKGNFTKHCRWHLPAELKDGNVFVCDYCKKSFTVKGALKSHMMVHMDHRPHVCEKCGRGFSQKGNLVDHMRIHTNERPFSCDKCDKSFKRTSELRLHKRYHLGLKPYKCETCGRDFRTSTCLKNHSRIHSGALPYACEFCEKRFRTAGVYRIHRRLHTGERPYSCLECNLHSTNWANHNKHMKRIHGIDLSRRAQKTVNLVDPQNF